MLLQHSSFARDVYCRFTPGQDRVYEQVFPPDVPLPQHPQIATPIVFPLNPEPAIGVFVPSFANNFITIFLHAFCLLFPGLKNVLARHMPAANFRAGVPFTIFGMSNPEVVDYRCRIPSSFTSRRSRRTTNYPQVANDLHVQLAPLTFNNRADGQLPQDSRHHGCLELIDGNNPIPAKKGRVRKVQPTRSRAP